MSRLLSVIASVALFAFAGDIVTDAVADVQGHLYEQTSHTSKTGACTVCNCAVHAGAVVFAASEPVSPIGDPAVDFTFGDTRQPIFRLPAAIDHPPQLS